ncbi:hypothetical protein PHSY_007103 [Pseudozyma hubeiensis SY62]|uniref:Uncharacterized protein n=1 Tax=Pseudozyma hubeiensis (strain SY62) TaxID=1305764 RepID=R9PDR9_PSEHS|nr:hypothetical protein PHSY_007103 [Pseudozyma hubeiensis SY62]GAC99501.1 hypothetical protein PHSY_007103 [Pseudozyma hubeiensis SY62]
MHDCDHADAVAQIAEIEKLEGLSSKSHMQQTAASSANLLQQYAAVPCWLDIFFVPKHCLLRSAIDVQDPNDSCGLDLLPSAPDSPSPDSLFRLTRVSLLFITSIALPSIHLTSSIGSLRIRGRRLILNIDLGSRYGRISHLHPDFDQLLSATSTLCAVGPNRRNHSGFFLAKCRPFSAP